MKRYLKIAAFALSAGVAMFGVAAAQFTAPAAADPELLLGDSTAVTGIYEWSPLVTTAAGVGMLIVLFLVGWKIARRVTNRVG